MNLSHIIRQIKTDQEEGRWDIAKSACEKILRKYPKQPQVNRILGDLLLQFGDHAAAARAYLTSYEVDTSQIRLAINLSFCLNQTGSPATAESIARQALNQEPSSGELQLNLGLSLMLQGKLGDARDVLEAYVAKHLNFEGLFNLGNVYLQLEQFTVALDLLRRARDLMPESDLACQMIATCLEKEGHIEDARGELSNALQRSPDNGRLAVAYALLLGRNNEGGHGISVLNRLIKCQERNADLYFARAVLHRSAGSVDLAIADYEKAFQLDGKRWDARFMASHLHLTLKNFETGWHLYQDRALVREHSLCVRDDIPVWQGDRTDLLLGLVAEQGIGDQILQLSMLSALLKLVPRVRVFCDERLIPLMPNAPQLSYSGLDQFECDPDIDIWLSAGDLGRFFRRSAEDFSPTSKPHLSVKSDRLAHHSESKTYTKEHVRRVGLSWVSKNPSTESYKSITPQSLGTALSDFRDFLFIDLNYTDTSGDREILVEQFDLKILRDPEVDFREDLTAVARLSTSCDLIVTVSNSVAHLAGGLGCRTLVLVPYSYGAMWYWHTGGGKNIWYPSVEVIRASESNDWSHAFKALKAKLEAFRLEQCSNLKLSSQPLERS